MLGSAQLGVVMPPFGVARFVVLVTVSVVT